MKRLCSLLLCALLLCAILPVSALAANTVEITVYNWGEYISDGTDDCINVIAEFEAAYPNIKVNYVSFDSNESLYSLMQNGGTSIDVIVPSDYMIAQLIDNGMLEPLDMQNIPNFEFVSDELKDPEYDPGNIYSVPYTWGAVGIIYNAAYVEPSEAEMEDWSLLWNVNYVGKILMFDNPRDSFAIAEYQLAYEQPENAADYDCNAPTERGLAACTELLQEQKGLVQNYVMDQIYDKMERCEAWVAPYYLGDWVQMTEVNEDLCFYVPSKAQHNLFTDALCIPTSCSHKYEAELFINFLTDPEISRANMEYVGYASPCVDLDTYLSEDIVDVLDRSANLEQLQSNGVQFLALPADLNQLMDSQWLSVKTVGDDARFYLILTAVAAVLVAALLVFLRVRKRKQHKRRCAAWKHHN